MAHHSGNVGGSGVGLFRSVLRVACWPVNWITGINVGGVEKDTILPESAECRFKGETDFKEVHLVVNLVKG